VRRTPEPPPAIPDEFIVSTSGDGAFALWQDSIVVLDDNSEAHVYFGPFSAVAGRTYTLRIQDADGAATTEYSTTVPPTPGIETAKSVLGGTIRMRVWLAGIEESPPNLAVVYAVTNPQSMIFKEFVYPYSAVGRLDPQGWSFEVLLEVDRDQIATALVIEPAGTTIALHSIYLRFDRESSEWSESNLS